MKFFSVISMGLLFSASLYAGRPFNVKKRIEKWKDPSIKSSALKKRTELVRNAVRRGGLHKNNSLGAFQAIVTAIVNHKGEINSEDRQHILGNIREVSLSLHFQLPSSSSIGGGYILPESNYIEQSNSDSDNEDYASDSENYVSESDDDSQESYGSSGEEDDSD